MTILTLPSSLILLSMVIPVTAVTQEARARSELSRASVDGVELEYEVQAGDRAGAVDALMRVVSGRLPLSARPRASWSLRASRAEPFVLPGTTHVLHVQEPRAMAERMAAFFERHPIR